MIEIKNATKYYSANAAPAIENINLTIEPGQIFGFIGPNGAGKSTLIKCMIGVIPFQGNIKICGYDIQKEAIAAKTNIGFVPDNHVIYEKLTGREYVNFISDAYRIPPDTSEKIFEKLVDIFNIGRYIDSQIGTYSHGTKQKIAVIGALVHNPKVWILDEPLIGLDPLSAYQLKELMKEHAKAGNTVFFSSHELEVVEKLCDRIAIINQGKIVVENDLEQLMTEAEGISLERHFLNITNGEKE